ncbi:MAG: 50S ribosomal protein L37e [Candidatus Lokiarchaeota archaeon]|nr:50S ribosomal protein L37e [Candidatus Lokiarchaeota archaeon]
MGKGTPSSGRKNKEGNHIRCRRCGRHSYHKKKKVCAACGFGRSSKMRHYEWNVKSKPSYGNKVVNRRAYKADNPRY